MNTNEIIQLLKNVRDSGCGSAHDCKTSEQLERERDECIPDNYEDEIEAIHSLLKLRSERQKMIDENERLKREQSKIAQSLGCEDYEEIDTPSNLPNVINDKLYEIEIQEARIKELEDFSRVYSGHLPSCSMRNDGRECTCGFTKENPLIKPQDNG